MPEENHNTDPLENALVTNASGENSFDISLLSESEQQSLITQYNEGMIDVQIRAAQLKVDVSGLDATLNSLADAVADINASGNTGTITHTQDSAAGRTEIIVGNSDRAQQGKLTRSQIGQEDITRYLIIGGVVLFIAVVIAILA